MAEGRSLETLRAAMSGAVPGEIAEGERDTVERALAAAWGELDGIGWMPLTPITAMEWEPPILRVAVEGAIWSVDVSAGSASLVADVPELAPPEGQE